MGEKSSSFGEDLSPEKFGPENSTIGNFFRAGAGDKKTP
jgi:hypothetical protein